MATEWLIVVDEAQMFSIHLAVVYSGSNEGVVLL